MEENEFSKPDNYVFFRAIRLPSYLSYFSLACESNAELEARKISRKIGKPTRIYEESKKSGNQDRAATLIIPEQRLFGTVGYALVKNNIENVNSFDYDMNKVLTGYGKDKSFVNSKRPPKSILKSDIDNFIKDNKVAPFRVINEVTLDIEADKDVSYVYYCNDTREVLGIDGLEQFGINNLKLQALYLKSALEENLKREIPIQQYSATFRTLKEVKFSPKQVNHILKNTIKNYNDYRGLLPILLRFKDQIKNDNEILQITNKKLSKIMSSYNWGMLNTKVVLFDYGFNVLKNDSLYKLNFLTAFSKCLKTFDRNVESQKVTQYALNTTLKSYANINNSIYNTRPKCKHSDIHMRNFTTLIEGYRELLTKKEFDLQIPKINETFKIVADNSIKKDSGAKLYIQAFKDKFKYLKDEKPLEKVKTIW